MKKRIIIGAALVVGLIVLIGLYGAYRPQILGYFENKYYERLQKIHDAEEAELLEAYKNDTFGGKTPEETFDLFLAALKAGDIELASKYYVIPNQEKSRKELQDEFEENGNLDLSIVYFTEVREKGIKECRDIDTGYGGCSFDYTYIREKESTSTVKISNQDINMVFPKGSEATKTTGFWLNKFTNVWKITQP